jgi:folate-dependent phosphoribosylglycinamide formyltransferase PurN
MTRIAIITQNDLLFIPETLRTLLRVHSREIEFAIVTSPGEFEDIVGSMRYYIGFWGLGQFLRFLLPLSVRYVGSILGVRKYKDCIELLSERGIEVWQGNMDINTEELVREIGARRIDYILSIAATQILKKRILNSPTKMCINIHAGLLPNYRGFNPSFWCMLNGEKTTGITIHKMVEELDAGPIIMQQEIDVGPAETWCSLQKRIATEAGSMLCELLEILRNDALQMRDQTTKGSQFKKPSPNDGKEFRRRGYRFI